jgi:hypothetical protein
MPSVEILDLGEELDVTVQLGPNMERSSVFWDFTCELDGDAQSTSLSVLPAEGVNSWTMCVDPVVSPKCCHACTMMFFCIDRISKKSCIVDASYCVFSVSLG